MISRVSHDLTPWGRRGRIMRLKANQPCGVRTPLAPVARNDSLRDGPRRMMPTFELLEHTADIGFEARADTPADLFQEAAGAFLFIAVDTAAVLDREGWRVEVAGDDYPSLLVNFLQELLYLVDTGTFVPCACEIEAIEPTRLVAGLRGEARLAARHPWKLMVKAVTYHGLEVTERGGRWLARVFLDV